MSLRAIQANPWHHGFEGVHPLLDFERRLNPLYRVFCVEEYQLKRGQPVALNNQWGVGYNFSVIDDSLLSKPSSVRVAAHAVYKVARYVFALLATATIVLPLICFAIKYKYIHRIRVIQSALDGMQDVNTYPNRSVAEAFHHSQLLIRNQLNQVYVPSILGVNIPGGNLVDNAEIPLQDAAFNETALRVRAAYQEMALTPEQRRQRLAMVSDNPQAIKNILIQVENEVLRQPVVRNQHVDPVHNEMTEQDFAKLRAYADYTHCYVNERDHSNLRFNNYGRDRDHVVHIPGYTHIASSREDMRGFYENFRLAASFMHQDDIPMDVKLGVLKKLSMAFDYCSPTWIKEGSSAVNKLNSPGAPLEDDIQSAREFLKGMFHDKVVELVETANYAVGGNVNSLDGFISVYGKKYGYTDAEIKEASRDVHITRMRNTSIERRLSTMAQANVFINSIHEGIQSAKFSPGMLHVLSEAAVNIYNSGKLDSLPDEALEDIDPDDLNLTAADFAIWLTGLYDSYHEVVKPNMKPPFKIPRVLVIQALRDVGIFL